MQQIEPTYLRYVYDGLSKGALSSNNAAGLPFGFIGLFEKEFQAHIPSDERSKLLRRLGVWALFKGAVSAEMSSAILDEHIDETKALIDRFTKWFNTPEPGKYVLYHDRLRTYLLQKLSDFEINELNEILIEFLESALEKVDGSEAEIYALEHLSSHMAVESELDTNYERLHNFVNKDSIWAHQLKVSKEYKWSHKAIQYGIKEGARRHHEKNTMVTVVNSVKLSKDEINSSKQILNLLNEGDYETALKRAESFNGENLMIIYLLMLHQLTLGNSKNENFRIKACKHILNLISELNSVTIKYPALLVYKYYEELNKIDLDSSFILEKLGYNRNSVLLLMDFESVKNETLQSLIDESISKPDLIPINLKIAQIDFLNGNNKNGIKKIEEVLLILDNLLEINFNKIFKLNEPIDLHYGLANEGEELYTRYQSEYLEFIFNWFHKTFEVCYDVGFNDKLTFIQKKLTEINTTLEKIIYKNQNKIIEIGAEDGYYRNLFVQKQNLIQNLIQLGELDSSFYKEAKQCNIFFLEDIEKNKRYLDFFLGTYAGGPMGYKKFNFENKLAISLLKTNNLKAYNTLIESIDNYYERGKVLVVIYKTFYNNPSYDIKSITNQVLNVIDNIKFSSELFYLIEDFYQVLIEINKNELAEFYLKKMIQNIGKISNVNQQFVADRLVKIIVAFSTLNRPDKIEEYFKLYCDVIININQDKLKISKSISWPLRIMGSKSINLICIKKLYDLIVSNENYIEDQTCQNTLLKCVSNQLSTDDALKYILSNNIVNQVDSVEVIKVVKSHKTIIKKYGTLNDSEHPSWLDNDISSYDFKPFHFENFISNGLRNESTSDELKEHIATCNFNDPTSKYTSQNEQDNIYMEMLNELIERGEVNYVVDNLLKLISLNSDTENNIINNQFTNSQICNEIIKDLNFERGLEIINIFDFEESVTVNQFSNIEIEYLLSKIDVHNKIDVLDSIYDSISKFKSKTRDNYILIDNKILGYKRTSKALKFKDFKDDAIACFHKWHNEVPKEILLNTRHHRKSSGYTVDMIDFCIGLFPNKFILGKIEGLLIDHSDNSEVLLKTCYLLLKINEKDKAVNLAQAILKIINKDPFIYKDLIHAREGEVAKFFYKLGEFNIADKIHSSISDYLFIQSDIYNYSQFEAKSNYYIETGSYDMILRLLESNKSFEFNQRLYTYYNILDSIDKLIKLNENSYALNIVELLYLKIKSSFDYDDRYNYNKFINFLKNLFILGENKRFIEILSLILNQIIIDDDLLSDNDCFKILNSSMNDWETDKKMNFHKNKFSTQLDSLLAISSKGELKYFDKNQIIDDTYSYLDVNDFFDEIFDNNQDYTFIISNLNSPEFYSIFLKHKAKMACFFENKVDQNKINLLSEVINISEWKRIKNQIKLK